MSSSGNSRERSGVATGVERIGAVLEAPVVERLPTLVESVEAVVLPVAAGVQRLQGGMATMARLRGWLVGWLIVPGGVLRTMRRSHTVDPTAARRQEP
jgi:hypothetical protein